MKNITIADDECWVCFSKENITVHHALPLHLQPKKNILIPVCRQCHSKINSSDIQGMAKMMFLLLRKSQKQVKETQVLQKYFDEYTKEILQKGVEAKK